MTAKRSLLDSFNLAQSSLVIQTADLPLGTLAGMVEENAIDLEPGFQRRERWKPEDQSSLIESFLLNVPVPPIYLSEEASGTYTAIDGKQRLRAITDFMNDRLVLKNLDQLIEADGMKFSDLPIEMMNALRLRPYLRVVTLLKQTDELLKYEVFLRLNRGGEALNSQEVRNVAFRGLLNDCIYQMAETPFLQRQLKITSTKSESFRQMQDAEYVLRFLALEAGLGDFRGNLSETMDQFMLRNKRASKPEVDAILGKFEMALLRCESIWGRHAFRRPDRVDWRDQTLAGMYDAQMLAVARLSEQQFDSAVRNCGQIIQDTRELFDITEFDKAVRTGTNTPARIRFRVDQMLNVLVQY